MEKIILVTVGGRDCDAASALLVAQLGYAVCMAYGAVEVAATKVIPSSEVGAGWS